MTTSKVEVPGSVDDLFNSSHPRSSSDPILMQETTVKPGLIETTQPISHPPVPSRNGIHDYLARRGNNLAEEENPFDSQFGGGPIPKSNVAKTPGGSLLPSIHALQSGSAPGFMDGLRQGPLSPNMLAGPKEPTPDYFSGEHGLGINDGPRVFTPNESALRHQTLPLPSGLTSPGGGSLFSASLGMQSPGLFGGVATPGTAEFNRTANEIRERQLATIAQQKREMNITSQPHQMNEDNHHALSEFVEENQSNAAASLFMLANSASSRDTSPHYNIPMGQARPAPPSTQKQILNRNQQILNQQMTQQMHPVQVNGQMVGRSNNQPLMNGHAVNPNSSQDPRTRTRNNSINSNASSPRSNGNSIAYESEMNGRGSQGPGKKRGTTKRKTSVNKTSPKNTKRSKGNHHAAGNKKDELKQDEFTNEDFDNMDDQDQGDMEENEENNDKSKSKKPETEDEKRKSFLERNRVAALKCRQRKKQWLNNLQAKVDSYASENEMLQQRVQAMSNEILQLRTMLIAHKDTPLGQQQGIAQLIMGPLYDEQQQMHSQNPYGMAGLATSQNHGMQ